VHRAAEGTVLAPDHTSIATVLKASVVDPHRGRDVKKAMNVSKSDSANEEAWAGFGPAATSSDDGLKAQAASKPATEPEPAGPILVGRLACVSKLIHFGSEAKPHKSPFFFKFRISACLC
jgi:hypothetical protein